MASGIQTIANEGVHMQPYFVEYIDDARGERIYTHSDPGTPVLDRQVALTAIDVLKGVLTRGTARGELADLAGRQPAFGKTGTQEKNWTAFFVGATPFLSTAVLVRDPDRYTPMAGIPEFANAGVDRIQGGTFPARIWGHMMDAIGLERVGLDVDWERPGPPARPPARLYLPGTECAYQVIAYEPVDTTEAPVVVPSEPVDDLGGEPPAGMRLPAAPPETQPPATGPPATQPPATQPPTPTTSTTTTTTTAPVDTAPDTAPPTTAPPRPVLSADQTGTTIPPDVLDPRAPLPSVPLDRVVRACGVTP
jgi:penicillin-binding protein 1A